jgi:putative transcriptional regulator
MIKIELEKLLGTRSLYWLSVQTGVRWATLAAMHKGTSQRLEVDVLDRVCKVLECEPGDLLVRVERRKAKARKRSRPPSNKRAVRAR